MTAKPKHAANWLRFGSTRGLVLIALGILVVGASLTAFVHDLELLPDRGFNEQKGFLPLVQPRASEGKAVASPQVSSNGSFFGMLGFREQGEPLGGDTSADDDSIKGAGTKPRAIPERIVIPAVKLDAPVFQAENDVVQDGGKTFLVWLAPDQFGAGWHPDSAGLGVPGNTVINGHHNVRGEVFRDLEDLEKGDTIILYSGGRSFYYTLDERVLVQERYKSLETRLQNANWIKPTEDERLTLVTCWPYEDNSYRLILVAKPMMEEILQNSE